MRLYKDTRWAPAMTLLVIPASPYYIRHVVSYASFSRVCDYLLRIEAFVRTDENNLHTYITFGGNRAYKLLIAWWRAGREYDFLPWTPLCILNKPTIVSALVVLRMNDNKTSQLRSIYLRTLPRHIAAAL